MSSIYQNTLETQLKNMMISFIKEKLETIMKEELTQYLNECKRSIIDA